MSSFQNLSPQDVCRCMEVTKLGVPCLLRWARCPAHKDRSPQDSLLLLLARIPDLVLCSRSLSVSTVGRLLFTVTLFSSVSGDGGGSTEFRDGDPVPEHLPSPQTALWAPDQRGRLCSPARSLEPHSLCGCLPWRDH